MTSSPDRLLAGAALVLALALFTFGRALVRAVTVDTGSVEPLPEYVPFDSASAYPNAPGLGDNALMLAVENDPFRPNRSRPPVRYRLPGDEEMLPPTPPPLPPAPDFRLAGTVVFAGGGMALIEVEEGAERLVHVGEAVSGYRLSGVTTGEAVLENPFRTLTLAVEGPPQRITDDDDDDDDDDDRRRGNRRDAEDRNEAAQRSLMQQIIQRVQQSGATRQQLQQLERAMRGADSPREMMEAYQRFMRNRGGGNDGATPAPAVPRERAAPAAASTRRVPPPNR